MRSALFPTKTGISRSRSLSYFLMGLWSDKKDYCRRFWYLRSRYEGKLVVGKDRLQFFDDCIAHEALFIENRNDDGKQHVVKNGMARFCRKRTDRLACFMAKLSASLPSFFAHGSHNSGGKPTVGHHDLLLSCFR